MSEEHFWDSGFPLWIQGSNSGYQTQAARVHLPHHLASPASSVLRSRTGREGSVMGDDGFQGQVKHSGNSCIYPSLSTRGRAGARRFPTAGPFGPKHGLHYLDTDDNSG